MKLLIVISNHTIIIIVIIIIVIIIIILRMEDSRWPKKIYLWTPHGRRRRGRPQLSWRNQVKDFIKRHGR